MQFIYLKKKFMQRSYAKNLSESILSAKVDEMRMPNIRCLRVYVRADGGIGSEYSDSNE